MKALDNIKAKRAAEINEAKLFLLEKFSERDPELIVNICAWHPDGGRGRFTNPTLTQIRETAIVQKFITDNSDRNIYFGHNLCKQIPKRGKADVQDLADIYHLFADIDPPKADVDLELFKSQSMDKLKRLQLPMTVIDSGGGIQFHIDLLDKLEPLDAKKYNSIFLWLLGADKAVKNPVHLARMPFTTNHPNEIKRKAGRVPCAAKLL